MQKISLYICINFYSCTNMHGLIHTRVLYITIISGCRRPSISRFCVIRAQILKTYGSRFPLCSLSRSVPMGVCFHLLPNESWERARRWLCTIARAYMFARAAALRAQIASSVSTSRFSL